MGLKAYFIPCVWSQVAKVPAMVIVTSMIKDLDMSLPWSKATLYFSTLPTGFNIQPMIVIVLVLAFTPSSGLNPRHARTMAHSCSLAKWLSCSAGHMVRHVLCRMIGRMFRHLTMTHHPW